MKMNRTKTMRNLNKKIKMKVKMIKVKIEDLVLSRRKEIHSKSKRAALQLFYSLRKLVAKLLLKI